MSLRLRLALITAALALSGLGLGLWLSSLFLVRLALAEVDHTLKLQAKVLLETVREEPDHLVPPEVEQEVLAGELPGAAWLYRKGELVWSGGLSAPPLFLRSAQSKTPRSLAGWRIYTLESQE
ncbi:two-component sensor histidine kinase, partial [Thermus scotoductus]